LPVISIRLGPSRRAASVDMVPARHYYPWCPYVLACDWVARPCKKERRSRLRHSIARTASLLLILVLACGFAPTGCGGNGSTIKVGAVLSLTGLASTWGQGWQKGIMLAVQELNGSGGISVDGGAVDIEVVFYDDGYEPPEAASAVSSLISDGVDFIIGPMSVDAVASVEALVEEAGVLLLAANAAPTTLGPDKPHAFSMFPSTRERHPAVHVWVTEKVPDARTWYGVVPDNPDGRRDQQVMTPLIEALGWEILGWEFYDPSTTDFESVLSGVIASDPDMIDTCSSPPGSFSLIWQQLYELGYRGLRLASASGEEPAALLARLGADVLEGGIMAWPDFLGEYMEPAEVSFRDRCVARFGSSGYDMTCALGGWDAVMVLAEAIGDAGTAEDVDRVMEALANVQASVPDGVVRFGGTQTYGIKRALIKDVMVGQWREGQYYNESRITPLLP